jgi:transcriptional regulator with XRE-family HTH domain
MGPRIKRLRKQRGLTQAELAEKIGINRVSLAKLESPDAAKHHLTPSLATLEKLARMLRVNPGTLLGAKKGK